MRLPDSAGSLDIWGHVNAYLGSGPLLLSAVIAPPGLLVGRGPHCDLRLDDSTVSWDHLELSCRRGSVLAVDLGSSNGTLLNARPLAHESRLRSGDVLHLGGMRLTVALRAAGTQQTTGRPGAAGHLVDEERELAAALVARYRASTSLVGRPATAAELAAEFGISEQSVQRRLDTLAQRLRIGPHVDRERTLLLAHDILERGLDLRR